MLEKKLLLADQVRIFLLGMPPDSFIFDIDNITIIKLFEPSQVRGEILRFNSEYPSLCISDNLYFPLLITNARRKLFIGSFTWLAICSNADNIYQRFEEAFCDSSILHDSSITVLANKYFFSSAILPVSSPLVLHSMLPNRAFTASYACPSHLSRDIFLSLGYSQVVPKLLNLLLCKLGNLRLSPRRLVLDASLSRYVHGGLPVNSLLSSDSYQDSIRKHMMFVIRPGMGVISDILSKSEFPQILPVYEESNVEMLSNAKRLHELGFSPFCNLLDQDPSVISHFMSDSLSLCRESMPYTRIMLNGLSECSDAILSCLQS